MTIEYLINLIKTGSFEDFSEALDQYLAIPGHTITDRDSRDVTLLMHATSLKRENRSSHHLSILELLVEKGDENLINIQQGNLKRTALMLAAEIGYTEGVHFLLSKKADPNKKDCLDLNALNKALHNNHYEAAEALVHYGVNVEKINNSGKLGRQGLFDIFWRALRMIPDTMIPKTKAPKKKGIREPDSLSKEYNQKLRKHPKITAQVMVKHPLLPQPIMQLIGGYLYEDQKLLNDFNKTIIFSLAAKAESKKPNLRGGRRFRRRNGH